MKRTKRFLRACLAILMVVSLLPMQYVTVEAAKLENLALNKKATESSVYPGTQRTAQKAVDGIGDEDKESRWSTKRLGTGTPVEQYDPNIEQWMMVDLEKEYTVNQVKINWEGAFAKKYVIQSSLDGKNFKDELETGVTGAGIKDHTDLNFTARYIRILCKEPANKSWGYSIYELEVYSKDVIDEDYEDSAEGIIAEIENEAPTLSDDKKSLILPEVPDGYKVELYGTDNAQVVSKENVVYQPVVDMPVKVMYKVTNEEDAKDNAASKVDAPAITIPGKNSVAGENKKPNVLPGLREWDGATGNFKLNEKSRIVYTDKKQKAAADMLHSYLLDMLDVDIKVVSGTQTQAGDIVLQTAYTTDELGVEGYYMNIDDVVTISAPADTERGWLYGAASITQILYQSDDFTAPKGLTRDYPQYEVRAGMIDVGRMYIPLEYLKEMTMYMSFYKMNEAHIHINDYWGQSGYSAFRLESTTYPSIVAKDGHYTKEEYKQYQKDMKAYGIDVITEIDTPYHAEAFRDVEGVKMLEGKAGYLDITTDEAFNANAKIIENLVDEYLDGDDPIIQSNNFHIGTDEYDKKYGEQMRKWTDHFAKYVNAKGYQSRAWASLGKNGFNGTTEVTDDIVMNLWAPYWSDVHETYDAGYDVINTYGGWLYIVPAGNAGYPDRFNTKKLYEEFEVNNFKSGRNPLGEAIMPVAHPQTKGASFALWNDMTSFKTGFSWFDIHDRIKDAVSLVSEKTWYGEDDNGQTYEEFRSRIDALQNKVPNANPGRFVESDKDLIAKYEFDDGGKDASTNGYDATLKNAEAKDGEVKFDGTGYLSLPMDSIGYPYTVMMNMTLDELNENATLFNGTDGTFYVNKLGKLSYARDQYEFTFNYTPKVGEKMALALTCDNKNLTLYVNGQLVGTGKLTNKTIAGKTQQSSTFVLPVEKVLENTKGTLEYMSIYNRVLSAEEIYKELDIFRENLALNKKVSVSGLEVNDGRFTGEMAVDGVVNSDSRVSLAKDKDEQWLLVDLGETKTVGEFVVNYESSVGKYEIQVSEDGETYTTVYTKNEDTVVKPTPATETITIDPTEARYVKYVQKERWKNTNNKWYSGSIYEFEVYAPISTTPKPSKDALVAKGPNSSGSLSAQKLIGPSTTKNVNVEFDMYTSLDPMETNTAVGLGSTNSNYTAYSQIPIIVRMYEDGYFGAYNGTTKSYVQSKVSFKQNEKYHIRIAVNLENNTFSAYATGPDGEEKIFAENYTYRAAAPSEIGKIYLFNNERPEGSYWLEKITVEDVKTPVVDKTQLNESIENAKKLDSNLYVDFSAVREALKNAEAVAADDNATKENVVNALDELNKAVEALKYKDADYSKVEEAIASVPKDLSIYTEASVKALNNAIDAVEEGLNITEQKKVDAMADAIYKAIEGLVEETPGEPEIPVVDKTQLNESIASLSLVKEDGYTPASWEKFTALLDAAKVVSNKADASQDEVNKALESLKGAMDLLVKKVDKTALNKAIKNAKELDSDLYVDFSAVREALKNAEAVATDDNATEENVANVEKALNKAVKALIYKDADYSKVEEAIANIPKDLSVYTKASVKALNDARDAVQYDLNITEQEKVDAMADAIYKAIEGLVKETPTEQEPAVDKTEIKNLIEYAGKQEEGKFTEDSWKALEEAVDNANKVLADEDATEADVKEAIDQLEAAINNLKLASTPEGEKPSGEDKPNKEETDDGENVQTGDTTDIAVFAITMLLAGAVLAVMLKKKKEINE